MPHTNTDLSKCKCDDCVADRARPRVRICTEPLMVTVSTPTGQFTDVLPASLSDPITATYTTGYDPPQ